MTLGALAKRLDLRVVCDAGGLDREVTGGYLGDLLSDVIGNSRAGDLWVTIQAHENAVAVATLRDLAGIVIVGGREPDEQTMARAKEEGVTVMVTPRRAFAVARGMVEAGVAGRSEP